MFYLNYRPHKISEIDNTQVREKILALLSNTSIPHAILLTGPKGTGKTSTARIIAKVINCQKNLFAGNGKNCDPCNKCENCLATTSGNSIDVIEIDAASNRKIDDIRELIAKVSFAPAHSRYKVYIIDEVHMLTKESFNSLLKTLEEPVATTIFILATTELDKIPATIRSRCFSIPFPKATQHDLIAMLKRIALSENIKVDEKVLQLVAKRADNSFRDGAKIFEQAYLQNALTAEGINNLVGLKMSAEELMSLIIDRNIKSLFEYLDNFENAGGDFRVLIESQLDLLHQILLSKNGIANTLLDNYNLTMPEIIKLIKLFQEAHNALKISPIESLPLELAFVEYCNTAK